MKNQYKITKEKKAFFVLFLLVIFLGIFIFWNATLLAQSHLNTIVRSISQGSDDAGLHPNGYFSTVLNEIYFGECYNGQEIVSGFRFQDIQIVNSNEIENAHIEFTVDGTYSNDIGSSFTVKQ